MLVLPGSLVVYVVWLLYGELGCWLAGLVVDCWCVGCVGWGACLFITCCRLVGGLVSCSGCVLLIVWCFVYGLRCLDLVRSAGFCLLVAYLLVDVLVWLVACVLAVALFVVVVLLTL